ncbi:hypothetical protein Tco_0713508 [Tanacetum coccineum]
MFVGILDNVLQLPKLNGGLSKNLSFLGFGLAMRFVLSLIGKLFAYPFRLSSRLKSILEEDVEPQPNLPLQEIIILDADDQPMWENAKTVAPTSSSIIVRPDVDNSFVINSTHLNMIRENKFDGYLRADPHDHIREFLAICDMFKYGETQSEASLKEEMHEMHEMHNNYNNSGGDHASKNDDTPMCERYEANYIQSEGYQNQNYHDSYLHQSHHDPNDSEKSLTELNNDVKNDLEDFKRCIHSMRTIHDKLFDKNV